MFFAVPDPEAAAARAANPAIGPADAFSFCFCPPENEA
jgi:hypothetical protein